jgi:hypothetical protein
MGRTPERVLKPACCTRRSPIAIKSAFIGLGGRNVKSLYLLVNMEEMIVVMESSLERLGRAVSPLTGEALAVKPCVMRVPSLLME